MVQFQPQSEANPKRISAPLERDGQPWTGTTKLSSHVGCALRLNRDTIMISKYANGRVVAWAFLVACAFVPSAALGQHPEARPTGDWIGGYKIREVYTWLKLRLHNSQGTLGGEITIPGDASDAERLIKVSYQPPNLNFEVNRKGERLVFQGQREAETLAGTVKQGKEEGVFCVVFRRILNPSALEALKGLYQAGPDQFLCVEGMRDGIPELALTDFRTGQMRAIFAEAKDRFFAGPTILVPFPKQVRLQFLEGPGETVT